MSIRTVKLILLLAICLGITGNITACGKKGPLYLPDKEQTK